jgi:hypothetical protein
MDPKPTDSQLLELATQSIATSEEIKKARKELALLQDQPAPSDPHALVQLMLQSCALQRAVSEARDKATRAARDFYRACYMHANGVYPQD